ncbi:formate/nitrite transporter [Spizellomyces punctatus DAOM BR117]|uniref:Formate/nitrite transporter n=1 Tax=Spizellomyces punctatus (strain DAOM BR117) TaxID=645134 RepID=A0A0L0HLJ5_SPIPD|nr:formate/nitrite transporter [Spizellomyces punctatus DAOM BR117]KND01775.1 formate/nitrite transporter [Spizellomyces punctatus DAOM BR117]|eukprot:XP_016609814.1 formate/nitrite transporter [Spizellomyces punctatus DAOM BR117]
MTTEPGEQLARPRPETVAVISHPATQPTYAAPIETFVTEAIARDRRTGLERRATIAIDAPQGSSVRMLGKRQSLVDSRRGSQGDGLPRDYNTGAELEAVVTSLGYRKSHSPIDKILFLGFLAGTWVSFAGLFAQQVVGGVPIDIRASWPVIPKLLIGITFPIGIVFIVIFGGELFTGNTMIMIVAWLNGRVRKREVLLNWTLVFFSNFAACAFFAYLLGYLPEMFEAEPYHSYVVSVATRKANLPFWKALLMGIPANALVCLAVFLGLAARDLTGKIIGLYLPIMTFAATGWEHCVANMYFISIGWMYGADVTVGKFARNISGVMLGNIIGGGLLIGCSEYYMYHWHRSQEPTKHFGKWGKAFDWLGDITKMEVMKVRSEPEMSQQANADGANGSNGTDAPTTSVQTSPERLV